MQKKIILIITLMILGGADSFGQSVKFSLCNSNKTFKEFGIESIIVNNHKYSLSPDSNEIVLDISLPAEFIVEFNKGFINGYISKTNTYCEDNNLHITLQKLRTRSYTYYQNNCSGEGIVGPVLKLKRAEKGTHPVCRECNEREE